MYIDEIGTFHIKTQQQLLTALQERQFQITVNQNYLLDHGQNRSVPCNFVLVAAGNEETIRNLHPALRSRIRGGGYEIVMQQTMPDNLSNDVN